ncbi:MAG: hypothetical protein ACYS15_21030 [Planctomycetota bacterium]|jgi:hypothetical protein
MRLALGILLFAAVLGSGCAAPHTVTRSVEVDAAPDVAFRAAAATLLDDRQVFELSDADAGLVAGGPPHSMHGYFDRTTFWVTPIQANRCFVIVQLHHVGYESPESLDRRLDWLLGRLRQRCVLGGDVTPFDEDEDADGARAPGGPT